MIAEYGDQSLAIVVPVYQEVETLNRQWPLFGSLGADELLFVDGGSNDGTVDVLRHSGFRWLATAPGRALQMNAGAQACKSDILLFLHVDTEVSESHLYDIKRAMQDQAVVGGRFDVELSGGQLAFRLIERMINLRSRLSRISTGDQAMFVRRSLFEQLGGFPDLPLMEDIAFSRRLKSAGRISCLRRPVLTSSRRWQQHGIMRTVWLMWKLRLLFWLGVPADRLAEHYRDAR